MPAVEHTYNLQQRKHQRPDYTNRYVFQATIIHCALKKLSKKQGLKKMEKKGETTVTAELEQLHKRVAFRTVIKAHKSLALLMFLKQK